MKGNEGGDSSPPLTEIVIEVTKGGKKKSKAAAAVAVEPANSRENEPEEMIAAVQAQKSERKKKRKKRKKESDVTSDEMGDESTNVTPQAQDQEKGEKEEGDGDNVVESEGVKDKKKKKKKKHGEDGTQNTEEIEKSTVKKERKRKSGDENNETNNTENSLATQKISTKKKKVKKPKKKDEIECTSSISDEKSEMSDERMKDDEEEEENNIFNNNAKRSINNNNENDDSEISDEKSEKSDKQKNNSKLRKQQLIRYNSIVGEANLLAAGISSDDPSVLQRLSQNGVSPLLTHLKHRDLPLDCADYQGGEVSIDFLESAYMYLQVADSAYQPSIDAAAKLSGLRPENFITFSSKAEIFFPAFFIAIDHERELIIISVRGSWEWNDWLTNFHILLEYLPPNSINGFGEASYVHHGFYQSMLSLLKIVIPIVTKQVSQYPDYKIRYTGHSLGGAVAALLALVTSDIFPSARAVTFAAPVVGSMNLAEFSHSRVLGFANARDLIPRAAPEKLSKILLKVPWIVLKRCKKKITTFSLSDLTVRIHPSLQTIANTLTFNLFANNGEGNGNENGGGDDGNGNGGVSSQSSSSVNVGKQQDDSGGSGGGWGCCFPRNRDHTELEGESESSVRNERNSERDVGKKEDDDGVGDVKKGKKKSKKSKGGDDINMIELKETTKPKHKKKAKEQTDSNDEKDEKKDKHEHEKEDDDKSVNEVEDDKKVKKPKKSKKSSKKEKKEDDDNTSTKDINTTSKSKKKKKGKKSPKHSSPSSLSSSSSSSSSTHSTATTTSSTSSKDLTEQGEFDIPSPLLAEYEDATRISYDSGNLSYQSSTLKALTIISRADEDPLDLRGSSLSVSLSLFDSPNRSLATYDKLRVEMFPLGTMFSLNLQPDGTATVSHVESSFFHVLPHGIRRILKLVADHSVTMYSTLIKGAEELIRRQLTPAPFEDPRARFLVTIKQTRNALPNAVLFSLGQLLDLPGVLSAAAREAMRRCGVSEAAIPDSVTIDPAAPHGLVEECMAKYAIKRKAAFADAWPEALHYVASMVPPKEGAEELLSFLTACGVPVAVIAEIPAETALELLCDAQLGTAVETVVGKGEALRESPNPGGILLACQRLEVGCFPNTVFVAQSDRDVVMARNAGVSVVTINDGENGYGSHGAIAFESLSGLLDCLVKLVKDENEGDNNGKKSGGDSNGDSNGDDEKGNVVNEMMMMNEDEDEKDEKVEIKKRKKKKKKGKKKKDKTK